MALTKISTGMLKQDAASSDLNIDAGTLYIDVSNNRVGVANTSPSFNLDVSGTGQFTGSLEVDSSILTRQKLQISNGRLFEVKGTSSAFTIRDGSAAADRLTILAGGNVGIGITNPSWDFVVSNGGAGGIEFGPDGIAAGTSFIQSYNRTSSSYDKLRYYASEYQFYIGGSTHALNINSSGYIGIGTSSPVRPLHIHQTSNSQMQFTDDTSGSTSADGLRVGWNGTEGQLYLFENAALRFATNNSERMRITSTGRVIIGDSGSATSDAMLSIEADAAGRDYVRGVTNTGFNNASLGNLSDNSAYFTLYDDNEAQTFLHRSDSQITYMSGNVGIGTSSPSHRLHITHENDAVILVESTGSDATDDANIQLKTTNGTFTIQNDRSLGSSGALTFAGNTSDNIVIDHSSGKVGIGTNSPGFKLEIADDTNGAVDLLRLRNSDSTYSQSFDFSLDTGKNLSITGASSNGGVIIKPGSYGTEIRRDAGGALGAKLVLRNYSNTAGSYVRLQLAPTQAGVDDRNVTIQGENVDGNNNMAMVFKVSAGASPAEAMRIDQNGNLLVGKQSAAFTSDGHEIRKDSYAGFTRDGGLPLLVNRRTSSGDMIEFYKDSTSIGTIGSIGGANLFINSKGSGGYGRLQDNGSDIAIWWSNGLYPGTDSAKDLGVGATSGRWRNLYLSNKVHAAYIGAGTDTNTSINFDTADTIKFVTGGAERGRFDSTGLYLANDAAITRAYRTLYNGSAAANTVQYIKLYDRDSTTAGSENLHFYMRGANHSEYSVEVKIFIPTYSGFTTSYGTMDAGQGIEVEIICGGLSSQGNVFQEIIEVANLSSTTDNTEIWLKTQVPHATTTILISEAADSTDTLIPTGNGSGWTTTAPSNQHRVFPIKIGKTINGIHTTRDSKLGVGTSAPGVPLHVYNASQGRVAIENASRRFDLAVDSDGLGFRDQTAAVTRMTLDTSGNLTFNSEGQKLIFNTSSTAAHGEIYTGDTFGSNRLIIEGENGIHNVIDGNSNSVGDWSVYNERLATHQIFLTGSNGYFGIGEASPSGPLHVKSTGHISYFEGTGGNVSIQLLRSDSSAAVDFGDIQFANSTGIAAKINCRGEGGSASGNLTFQTRNTSGTLTERMRIQSGGKVGIGGTVMDGQKLNIEGWVQSDTRTPANAWLIGRGTGGDGLAIGTSASTPYATWFQSGYLPTMGTSNHYALSFNPYGGNVGIGTTNPLNPLHVKQTGGTHLMALETSYSTDRTGRGQISWRDGANITGAIWTEYDGSQVSMRFGNLYNSGYNTNTSMIIRGNGNVGIGTTSPSETLELTRLGKIGFGMNGNYGVRIGYFDDTGGVHGFHVDTKHAGTVTSETRFIVRADTGRIGIGNKNPGETLHIGSGQSNYIRIHNAASGDVASGITITRGNSTGFALYDNPADDTTTFNAIGNMNFRTDGSSYRLYISDIGRVGINTNSLGADGLTVGTATNGNCELDLNNTSTNGTRWRLNSSSSGDLRIENKTDSTIPFVIEDTGNVGIGTTSPSSNGIFSVTCNLSAAFMGHFSNVNGSGYGLGLNTVSGNTIFFYHNSSNVGSITTTSTYTSYATTSDVRLKENITDAPSASEDIDAIQVRSFDWKADGSHQKYGMVAQELAEVIPSAVNVPEEEERMQSVDYSKLVPMLVKEVQSLRARVAELEGDK